MNRCESVFCSFAQGTTKLISVKIHALAAKPILMPNILFN